MSYEYIIFEREKKTNNRRRIISTERRAHVTFTSRHIIAETGRRPIDMATNRKYRSTHLRRRPSYYHHHHHLHHHHLHHYYYCCDVRCCRPCYMSACVYCVRYTILHLVYYNIVATTMTVAADAAAIIEAPNVIGKKPHIYNNIIIL